MTQRPYPKDYLVVELEVAPEDGGFILNTNVIGDPLTETGVDYDWEPIECDIQNMSIRRGGQQQGVYARMDVGTCTIQVKNILDPATDERIKPNVPVRVMDTTRTDPEGGPLRLFTGRILDLKTDLKDKGRWKSTTIIAVDAMNVHTNTPRFGAAGGPELWEARINRLAQSAQAPVVTPPPNANVVLWTQAGAFEQPKFPPQLQIYDYGQGGPATVARKWYETTLSRPTVDGQQTVSMTWLYNGPSASMSTAYEIQGGSQISFKKKVNTQPGARYKLSGEVRLDPSGRSYLLFGNMLVWATEDAAVKTNAAPMLLPNDTPNHAWQNIELTFDAVLSSYTFNFGPDEFSFIGPFTTDTSIIPTSVIPAAMRRARIRFRNLKFEQLGVDGELFLGDTVYEGPLSTHFDMACQTVGASWYVDRHGITRFKRGAPDPAPLDFSNVHDPGNPEHACYVDISSSFDTANIVNELTLANHLRKFEDGRWLDDTQTSLHRDDTSHATFGPRSATADITLDTGNPASLSRVAARLLNQYSTTSPAPPQLLANYDDMPAIPELLQTVGVELGEQEWIQQVTAVEHQITPKRHTVTLLLTPPKEG